jgi:hypothetical protein
MVVREAYKQAVLCRMGDNHPSLNDLLLYGSTTDRRSDPGILNPFYRTPCFERFAYRLLGIEYLTVNT